MKRTTNWIQTYNGIQFYPLEPKLRDINIGDIAHALSLQCRFAGHTPYHYSVAQHSLLVVAMVRQEYKRAALLHDASEAYLVDIPRPIKKELGVYKAYEERLSLVLAKKFRFEYPYHSSIKAADDLALTMEMMRFFPIRPALWSVNTLVPATNDFKHLFWMLDCNTPEKIEDLFLHYYNTLL